MKKEEVIEKTYNSLARKYHEARTVLKTGSYFFNECLEMPATLSFLGNVKNKKVLDLGCGTGIYASLLLKKGAKVWGIDQSEGMLKIARQHAPKAYFQKGTVYQISFPNNSFDIVLSALVIDHVKDLLRMFKEVKRVLKKGGIFVFPAPNPISECRILSKIGNQEYRIFGHNRNSKKVFGDYFTEKWQKVKWTNKTMYNYHRTYETMFKMILQSGMKFVAYKDAKPTIKSKVDKINYKIFSRIPLFYSVKLKK